MFTVDVFTVDVYYTREHGKCVPGTSRVEKVLHDKAFCTAREHVHDLFKRLSTLPVFTARVLGS